LGWNALPNSITPASLGIPTKALPIAFLKLSHKGVEVEDLNTRNVMQYDSTKSAGEALGVHRSQISLAIKNKKPVRNYMFRFADIDQADPQGDGKILK